MCAVHLLVLYCGALICANVTIVAYVTSSDLDDESPESRSQGAWWHLVSNAIYLIPYIPYAIVTRPACLGGLDGSGRQRADILIRYIVIVAVFSSLHHAFEYDTKLTHALHTAPIKLLMRYIDWSVARLSATVGIYCAMGLEDLMVLARPRAEDWWLRSCVVTLAWILISAAVMNEMRYVASRPFSEESILGSIVCGVAANGIPFTIALCMGGLPLCRVVGRHLIGSPQGIAGTLSLLSGLGGGLCTRLKGDDDSGVVHAMWHFATSSILGSTMILIFDKDA